LPIQIQLLDIENPKNPKIGSPYWTVVNADYFLFTFHPKEFTEARDKVDNIILFVYKASCQGATTDGHLAEEQHQHIRQVNHY
jgi:hypothetical protein